MFCRRDIDVIVTDTKIPQDSGAQIALFKQRRWQTVGHRRQHGIKRLQRLGKSFGVHSNIRGVE
ncbi:hypothetical protein D3C87_2132230 [compost metagenome]